VNHSDEVGQQLKTLETECIPSPRVSMEYMSPSDIRLSQNAELNQEAHHLLTQVVDPQGTDQAPDPDQIAVTQRDWATEAVTEQIDVKPHEQVRGRQRRTTEEGKGGAEQFAINLPSPPSQRNFDSVMELFSKWIKIKNDNTPYLTNITKSEIETLLKDKSKNVNPDKNRLEKQDDVLIISFSRKTRRFPFYIRDKFYK